MSSMFNAASNIVITGRNKFSVIDKSVHYHRSQGVLLLNAFGKPTNLYIW